MRKDFESKDLETFYYTGKSKKIPSELKKRLLNKLEILLNTVDVDDLKVPPSNHLEKLLGDLKEYYSIKVNDQFRIIFKFDNRGAHHIAFTDYH